MHARCESDSTDRSRTWARVSARQDPHTSRRYKGSRRRLENVASGYIVTGKEVPPRYVTAERSYLPLAYVAYHGNAILVLYFLSISLLVDGRLNRFTVDTIQAARKPKSTVNADYSPRRYEKVAVLNLSDYMKSSSDLNRRIKKLVG